MPTSRSGSPCWKRRSQLRDKRIIDRGGSFGGDQRLRPACVADASAQPCANEDVGSEGVCTRYWSNPSREGGVERREERQGCLVDALLCELVVRRRCEIGEAPAVFRALQLEFIQLLFELREKWVVLANGTLLEDC